MQSCLASIGSRIVVRGAKKSGSRAAALHIQAGLAAGVAGALGGRMESWPSKSTAA
jgi:hypothetical protein